MWVKVLRYEMNNLNYLGQNTAEYFIEFIIVLFLINLKGKLLSSVAMICTHTHTHIHNTHIIGACTYICIRLYIRMRDRMPSKVNAL